LLLSLKKIILIEVEIKIQIFDLVSLVKAFERENGRYKLSLIHEDTYYNMPKGLRDFKKTDEALRIRNSIEYNKLNEGDSKDFKAYITYKGKKIDKISKSRQEIECRIENPEQIKEIFSILGFRDVFTVKKERELYEFVFNGHKIEALIDYLPILDRYFLEVELITDFVENLEKRREILFNFLKLFGYDKKDSIRKSYLELILEKKSTI